MKLLFEYEKIQRHSAKHISRTSSRVLSRIGFLFENKLCQPLTPLESPLLNQSRRLRNIIKLPVSNFLLLHHLQDSFLAPHYPRDNSFTSSNENWRWSIYFWNNQPMYECIVCNRLAASHDSWSFLCEDLMNTGPRPPPAPLPAPFPRGVITRKWLYVY